MSSQDSISYNNSNFIENHKIKIVIAIIVVILILFKDNITNFINQNKEKYFNKIVIEDTNSETEQKNDASDSSVKTTTTS
jgi:hypothetical protein